MEDYGLLGEISRGKYGRIERVRNAAGQVFARKVFSPATMADGAYLLSLRQRFLREVGVQWLIGGEYAIPVLAADLDTPEPWYVMPIAECNYQQQIDRDRMSGTINRDALTDILNALERVHQLGYTHRDLKPQNILKHDDKWKLADFGLVLPPYGVAAGGSACGTVLYCAPEQAQDFQSVTAAVDIYAFGCILHDLVSNDGRVPYSQHTCSGTLGPVIEKCTAVDPERRFKNVAALRTALFKKLKPPLTLRNLFRRS